jgi:hypothetical protein
LRPEFMRNYHQPLRSDTFKDYQGIDLGASNSKKLLRNKDDIQDLSNASKYLKSEIIPVLVHQLDDLKLVPIDSESLSTIFHSHGVNMRYLSHVACRSEVPHVRQICVTEMFARVCKNIVNSHLGKFILDNKTEYFQLVSYQKEINQAITDNSRDIHNPNTDEVRKEDFKKFDAKLQEQVKVFNEKIDER